MKNTVYQDKEISSEIVQEYKEKPAMEALWIQTFGEEYKPHVMIDFQKIKDFIIKNKEDNKYWALRDYNYQHMDPEKLCNIFIKSSPKQWNISFLESFSQDTKKCLADMFVELVPVATLQKKL